MESIVELENLDLVDKALDSLGGWEGLIRMVDRYVKKCKKNAGSKESCHGGGRGVCLKVKSKNMVELRNCVISDFVKQCGNKVKKCLYCAAPVRSLRHESRAKVFLKGLSGKQARSWLEARRGRGLPRSGGSSSAAKDGGCKEGEGEMEEEEEGEMEEEEVEDDFEVCPTLDSLTKQTYVSPLEVKSHVDGLWTNQRTLMKAIVGCSVIGKEGVGQEKGQGLMPDKATGRLRRGEISPADIFFLEVIPVPPSISIQTSKCVSVFAGGVILYSELPLFYSGVGTRKSGLISKVATFQGFSLNRITEVASFQGPSLEVSGMAHPVKDQFRFLPLISLSPSPLPFRSLSWETSGLRTLRR